MTSAAAPDAMSGWIIEPMRSPDELDAVVAVETATFTNPSTRAMYESEFAHNGLSRIMLARTPAGELIGFCAYWRVVDEVHINNLAVLAAFRRRGIARALMERVLTEARADGATRALLEVRRSNADARRLYEGLGFTLAGVRRQYYSQPVEDALVLWREHLDRPAPIPNHSRGGS